MKRILKLISPLAFLILLPLIFFQNCGKGFESNLANMDLSSLAASQQPILGNPPPSDPSATAQPLDFGTPDALIYRGDQINLKISRKDPLFPDEFKITAINSATLAGVDFLPYSQTLKFDAAGGPISQQLQTLIPDPYADAKELVLQIEYQKGGKAERFFKKFLVRSRFEKASYRSIRNGYSHMCGLGLDEQVYCWGTGSGGLRVFPTDRQPVRYVMSNSERIDFASLQIGDTVMCFRTLPSRKVFCPSSNVSPVTTNKDRGEIIVDAASPLNVVVDQFGVAGTGVYFTDAEQNLFYKYIFNTTAKVQVGIGKKYVKIFPLYMAAIVVNQDGGFEYNNGFSGANSAMTILPKLTAALDYRTIVGSTGSMVYTNTEKAFSLPSSDASAILSYDLPQPFFKSNDLRLPCYVSETKEWFCFATGGYQKMVTLSDYGLGTEIIAPGSTLSFCALKENGDLVCKGQESSSYPRRLSFSKNAAFPFYLDLTQSEYDKYNNLTMVLDPFVPVSGETTADCQLDSMSVVVCNSRKVFGNNLMNYSSIKAFAGILWGETIGGRKLAYNYVPSVLSGQPEQLYKLVAGQENVEVGPLTPGCLPGFIMQGTECKLQQPITVSLTNGARVISFPNTRKEEIFEINLSRPLAFDFIFNVREITTVCGTDLTISGACLPKLATLCSSLGCAADDFSFVWANTPAGGMYNRFDWNFKYAQRTVVIRAGQTKGEIKLLLSNDLRKEKNRVLQLAIEPINPNYTDFAVAERIEILFRKMQNPEPTAGVATFSALMNRTSGPLGQSCVKCHNNFDRAGNYDMTDYDGMVANGVLNLTNLPQSKMYIRIDPTSTGFLARPMPMDGFLPQQTIILIQQWILNGAKNN